LYFDGTLNRLSRRLLLPFYSLPILLNEKEKEIIIVACGMRIKLYKPELKKTSTFCENAVLSCDDDALVCSRRTAAQQQLDSFSFNDIVSLTNERYKVVVSTILKWIKFCSHFFYF
jgi:hypothetical protein